MGEDARDSDENHAEVGVKPPQPRYEHKTNTHHQSSSSTFLNPFTNMKVGATLLLSLGVAVLPLKILGQAEEILTYDVNNDCPSGGTSVAACGSDLLTQAHAVNCFAATTVAPLELEEVGFWLSPGSETGLFLTLWDGDPATGPNTRLDSRGITGTAGSNIVTLVPAPTISTNEFCVGLGLSGAASDPSYLNIRSESTDVAHASYFQNGCDSTQFGPASGDLCINAVVVAADTTMTTTSTSTTTPEPTTTTSTATCLHHDYSRRYLYNCSREWH